MKIFTAASVGADEVGRNMFKNKQFVYKTGSVKGIVFSEQEEKTPALKYYVRAEKDGRIRYFAEGAKLSDLAGAKEFSSEQACLLVNFLNKHTHGIVFRVWSCSA